jgi:transketolase
MSDTMRDAFGKKLAEEGAVNKKLVVLDADVSGSSKSSHFAKAFPERFYNCGVSEGNMAGVAAGLSSAGFHPVINAFAIFIALKCTDQLRHDFCYNHLPLIIGGAYGGLSDSYDGASHQAIADIAIMRALPNMQVLVPSDSAQAAAAVDYALTQDGPVYIRLNRNALPDISETKGFAEKDAILLKSGKDVTIAANGITCHAAQEAAALLAKEGIDAEVFSAPWVKPFGIKSIAESVKKTGKLVSVEEHNILGGFGSAALEALADKGGIHFAYKAIGMQDTFGDTGGYNELLDKFGLSAQKIAASVKQFLK